MSLKRDLELFYEIGCFRFLQRTWKQFLNLDVQNISEHIFRVMWIALVISKHENVGNHEKILKMVLIHDIPESRGAEVHYLSRQYVDRHEEEAIEDILKNTALDNEFVDLWKEYDKKECIEAKIIKDADNLDCDLEIREQMAKGHQLESWKESRENSVYKNFYTETAKKIWKEIYSSNPHDWHLNARNRFRDGDWKNE